MQCSALSAFTRVCDALWRCAADPGSTWPIIMDPGSAEQRIERCTAPGTRELGGAHHSVRFPARRVDTPRQRPTLALFRGELRRGAERPHAQMLFAALRDRGDPLNLIRVMPAKGQGCIRVRMYGAGRCPSRPGGNLPFPSLAQALPAR